MTKIASTVEKIRRLDTKDEPKYEVFHENNGRINFLIVSYIQLSLNTKITLIDIKINLTSIINTYKFPGEQMSGVYDIVIIAAPMTSDQENKIFFEGFKDSDIKFEGSYQTTYATFVAGTVNSSYFGLNEDLGGILSCNPVKTVISSIGKLSSVEGKISSTPVWKIFTRHQLDDLSISKMFSEVSFMNYRF